MKVLLTGVAGTGKSTIIKTLNERGVLSLDLHDIPDLFFWQDKETKEKVQYVPAESKEWFDTVDRLCDISRLNKILSEHDNVIVAGATSGSNQKEFLSFFDKIILLQANPETLVHRMQTRTNKSGYGKTKAEQDDNIEWQKEFDPKILSYGAIPMSTEGDITDVLDNIIELVKSKPKTNA